MIRLEVSPSRYLEPEHNVSTPPWWKSGILYQIYPRSFQDSDGDGVGDLRGIIRRLPYLVELGIDALWLSPIFPSPMDDFGYDISENTDIDPLFGTLEDFDALVDSAHGQRLKVILDLVPNHTSDRHPWFAKDEQLNNPLNPNDVSGQQPYQRLLPFYSTEIVPRCMLLNCRARNIAANR